MLSYLSIGEVEDYRFYWQDGWGVGNPSFVGEENPNWAGNYKVKYWEDDCLEVFIDSDASGGNHQYNHSAFAYHIALDNQVVDIGDDQKAHIYNEHVTSRWQRHHKQPEKIIWEVAIKLFPNHYSDNQPLLPIQLKANQKLGFMLAYCDNDGSKEREHFIGSTDIKAVNGSKNLGYITADVFSQLTLTK